MSLAQYSTLSQLALIESSFPTANYVMGEHSAWFGFGTVFKYLPISPKIFNFSLLFLAKRAIKCYLGWRAREELKFRERRGICQLFKSIEWH